ncbi:MAG TPA: hypothetical protein VFY93_13560 [Planctomycetota bacterium]|nr:hypothetical protein [Planctomycetota bacterium]
MRALTLILVAGLLGLSGYYVVRVAPLGSARPVAVQPDGEESSAPTFNNRGVQLAREGRDADALAYFRRAHDFRPLDPVYTKNVARQQARMRKAAFERVLAAGGGIALLLVLAWGVRGARDHARLARVRLRGDPWFVIPREGDRAELPLRFSEPLGCLVRRHPLTIVWSSACHGKHMKSRPPVDMRGNALTVRLEGERLERLRRYPGEWKGFLYLGKTQVGEAAARVV